MVTRQMTLCLVYMVFTANKDVKPSLLLQRCQNALTAEPRGPINKSMCEIEFHLRLQLVLHQLILSTTAIISLLFITKRIHIVIHSNEVIISSLKRLIDQLLSLDSPESFYNAYQETLDFYPMTHVEYPRQYFYQIRGSLFLFAILWPYLRKI